MNQATVRAAMLGLKQELENAALTPQQKLTVAREVLADVSDLLRQVSAVDREHVAVVASEDV